MVYFLWFHIVIGTIGVLSQGFLMGVEAQGSKFSLARLVGFLSGISSVIWAVVLLVSL